MAAPFEDAHAGAMRAQALYGLPVRHATSRKYALSASALAIPMPLWNKKRPHYMRLDIGTGITALYLSFDGDAVVPTTSVDGAPRLPDQAVLAVWTQDTFSVIPEGTGTLTISYYWT